MAVSLLESQLEQMWSITPTDDDEVEIRYDIRPLKVDDIVKVEYGTSMRSQGIFSECKTYTLTQGDIKNDARRSKYS